MPDLHFDFGFPANVKQRQVSLGARFSPVESEGWILQRPIRKSLSILLPRVTTKSSETWPFSCSVEDLCTRNHPRAPCTKLTCKEGLNAGRSLATKCPRTCTGIEVRRSSGIATIRGVCPQDSRRVHELGEEVSTASEEALKAQKLKNRISSGFMPDQTPLTDVIKSCF